MKSGLFSWLESMGAERTMGESWRKRLGRNWFFAASAFAFYALNVEPSATGVAGIVIAALMAAVMAARAGSLAGKLRKTPAWMLAAGALGAIGVCATNVTTFKEHWEASSKLLSLCARFGFSHDGLLTALGATLAALSLWYVLVLFCALYRWLRDALRESGFALSRAELVATGALFVVLAAYMAYAFSRSVAFYGGKAMFDLVYTADSSILVRENAYLSLTQLQNDVRQPLFAVFAAPLVAPLYTLSYALPFVRNLGPILLNLSQVALLVFAALLLSKLADVRPAAQIGLMAVYCASFMTLLFTVMMEQYIVSVFWLALLLYLCKQKPERGMLPMMGAAGSMLTSAALAPVLCLRAEQSWKNRLLALLRVALCGLAAMLFFGRFNILVGSANTVIYLSRFTGVTLPLSQRLLQYVSYVAGCFAAPASGAMENASYIISWQLLPVTQIDPLGVALIALALVSLALNRRDWLCRVCGYWVACSFAVLCLVGWGTAENGLVLYSLYFGWAYLLLLFKLAQWALDKLKLTKWLPALCALAAGAMLWHNLPRIAEMLRFLAEKYPA